MRLWLLWQLWAAAALLLREADGTLNHPRLPHSAQQLNSVEMERDYWYANAHRYLHQKLEQQVAPNRNRARNIILFLGDGMSLATATAARSFVGDAAEQLSFERFPHFGLSKTYSADRQVSDSASTATAYLSGVKANQGTVGVTEQVRRTDYKAGQNAAYHTKSIAKWAQDVGMWTGLVTTARVTHASPAGVYANVADRRWESDKNVRKGNFDPREVTDIARQLVEWPVGRQLRVIMGGGRRNFIDSSRYNEANECGHRKDGRNLIKHWLDDKANARAEYMRNKRDLLASDLNSVDYLLGLFCHSHCPYHGDLERKNLTEDIPSLSEMTEAAVRVLRRGPKGYFLFVEGARIDMAHHSNMARKSLEDTVEFHTAVQLARNMTSEEDTLIVVTADHGHTMTINGYPSRTADILGLNGKNADDDLPYTILSYANGRGYKETYSRQGGRKNLALKDFQKASRKYMATVPLGIETHSGEDVGVYALGPYADLFSGNYEQTNIPMLMARAASIGPFATSRNNTARHHRRVVGGSKSATICPCRQLK